MEKYEHVISLSMETKNRVDKIVRSYKAATAKDILKELLDIGSIDTITYGRELRSLYRDLGFGRIE